MDGDHFDRFARRLSLGRRALTAGLAALLALGAESAAAKLPACPPRQKRCGRRCIPRRVCCPRTQRRCGSRCLPKRACCPGTKRCGASCIPATRCCTDTDCGAFKLCAGGECVVGQGLCTATSDFCASPFDFDCGVANPECVCFKTTVDASRCGLKQFPSPATSCLNDLECGQSFPGIPGVFCASGNIDGKACPFLARCVAPCPG